MSLLIYNLGVGLYCIVAVILSPFKKKARLWVQGRKEVFKYLKKEIVPGNRLVWFHAASLGEFEQGRPIMEAFKKKNPEVKILLTFFSPSGYEVRKNFEGADYICYLPLDTRRNASRFLKLTNPETAFFIKYEYWYHFIKTCKKQGVKLISISAIFREKHIFFKSYGAWYRKMLRYFDYFFVQNEMSASLLKSIGVNSVTIAGDSRFDRVAEIAAAGTDIDLVKEFTNEKFTFVCGSTWEPDEILIAEYINKSEDTKFIIAPHEIHQAHLDSLLKKISKKTILFSDAKDQNLAEFDVLIINNIGMLSQLYKYGQVSYIGGGFGSGIHNTLEAAVYGVPVIFGPRYQKFQEAVALVSEGGGFSISSFGELESLFNLFLWDSEELTLSSNASANYVKHMIGATETILTYLEEENKKA